MQEWQKQMFHWQELFFLFWWLRFFLSVLFCFSVCVHCAHKIKLIKRVHMKVAKLREWKSKTMLQKKKLFWHFFQVWFLCKWFHDVWIYILFTLLSLSLVLKLFFNSFERKLLLLRFIRLSWFIFHYYHWMACQPNSEHEKAAQEYLRNAL